MADDEPFSPLASGTPQPHEALVQDAAAFRDVFAARASPSALMPAGTASVAPSADLPIRAFAAPGAASLLMQLRALEQELEDLAVPAEADLAAARAAGFHLHSADDLQIIKGLGPQAEKMLKSAGIRSLHALAGHPDSQLLRMFQLASPRLRRIRPNQWQAQARLAAANRWQDLRQLQDSLRKTRKR